MSDTRNYIISSAGWMLKKLAISGATMLGGRYLINGVINNDANDEVVKDYALKANKTFYCSLTAASWFDSLPTVLNGWSSLNTEQQAYIGTCMAMATFSGAYMIHASYNEAEQTAAVVSACVSQMSLSAAELFTSLFTFRRYRNYFNIDPEPAVFDNDEPHQDNHQPPEHQQIEGQQPNL